jgi:hypothetical protein
MRGWVGLPAIHISLAVVMVLSVAPRVSAQCAPQPLSITPRKNDIDARNAIEALLVLGQANSVCLAVELNDDQLVTAGERLQPAGSFADMVKQYLLRAKGYQVQARNRIVAIVPTTSGPPTWLDTIIPRFSTSRSADVQSLSNLLFMDLVLVDNPHHGGFAGGYLGGDPKDQIEPVDKRNESVRNLLDLIVTSSKGGLWITVSRYGRSLPISNRPFWRVLEYSQPLSTNLGIIEGVAREVRANFQPAQQ